MNINKIVQTLDCELERVRSNLDLEVCYYTISNCTESLRELAKHPQYTVEIRHNSEVSYHSSVAYLNTIYITSGSKENIRRFAFDKIYDMHRALKLPMITNDQVTFVEI